MASPQETAQKTLENIKQFWAKQEKKNKILYISVLAALIVLAVVVAVIANHKDYVVLYSGLETTEAAEIAQLIEAEGYSCTVSGGSVTVQEGTENAIAMALAQQGYPKNQVNYDIYTSNVGMFTTESEKKEYSRMAKESRLSAIISTLDVVESANVTLSIPEEKNTVIAAYKADPTASVVLTLRNGNTLSARQIQGVTYIVKQSVAGLKEENISIVDSDGLLLIAGETNIDVIAEETKKLKFKTDLENQIKDKIIELLAPAYNEDGLSVAVNMVLNFDSKVSEDTVYSPSTEDERGMLAEAKSENATGYGTANGGPVGTTTNADDTYPTGNTEANGNWSESSVDNIYLVNTYKEQVEKAGYTIDSLSVSVIIYTDYLPDTTKNELVSLVGNAASINPDLVTDVVTVTSLPKFGEAEEATEEKTYLFGLTLNQLIILAAILVGILLILIIVLVVLNKKTKTKRAQFERQIIEANSQGANEPLVDSFFLLGEPSDEKINIPSLIEADGEETKDVIIRREIASFAKQRPEIVAQLLRSWMNGELTETKKQKKPAASDKSDTSSDQSDE